jgi:adenylate cyclase
MPFTLLGTLLGGFLISYGVRYLVFRKYMKIDLQPGMSGPQFRTEFMLFIAVGAILAIYNTFRYGFPLESGIKLMVGCATLGFFAAIDLALDQEYRLVKRMLKNGRRLTLDSVRTSLTRKFTLFSVAGVAGAITVMFLILTKDLEWLAMFGPEGLPSARKAVWTEIVFVGAVFLLMLVGVISSYSRNLRIFFDNETSVLDNVAKGKLDRYVPVSTEDEFGLIATRTNQMIDGLRERNRIKDMFGKFLNPKIADALLSQGEEALKPGGSRRNLVILMSDVRNFTSSSESLTPEQVVVDLNRYFSRMVEIIHSNHGIVDKFIGDGMLAYYGLNDPSHAVSRALRSALQMQAEMEELRTKLSTPFRIGIGIHAGEVIAGKIGSTEKLEFTVIGDVVNTAARLEGLSKELDAAIIVSSVVHDRLSAEGFSLPWTGMGERKLKGKGQVVDVYGIRHTDVSSAMTALGSLDAF